MTRGQAFFVGIGGLLLASLAMITFISTMVEIERRYPDTYKVEAAEIKLRKGPIIQCPRGLSFVTDYIYCHGMADGGSKKISKRDIASFKINR